MPTEWLIGYLIGGVVVLIVAVLAIILILQARKIGDQALDILAALEEGRDNTKGLWAVDGVNRSLESVRQSAREARIVLSGGDR